MPPCIGYLSHSLSEAADLERSSGWVGVTHHQSRATLLELIVSLVASTTSTHKITATLISNKGMVMYEEVTRPIAS